MKRYPPANLNQVRTYSLEARPTRVERSDFASVCETNPTLSKFLDSLPHILKADDLRAIVDAIVAAYQKGKPVVAGIGGHVIKCGLSPLLIHLMEKGVITVVVMNGGASIHDFEMALIGRTSEDVAASLDTGMFGMVRETGEAMNAAIAAGAEAGLGMGEALGRKLLELKAPFVDYSVLAAGVRLGVPVMVHVAIGGDTIHMHPGADGAAIGATSFTDFRILVSVLCDIGDGGVYLNIGSAVMLPEVFLKALNLARNLADGDIVGFTTVNMDMIQHYRPTVNVVQRPTQSEGAGYALTGHHEIMVPLLVHLVLAELSRRTPEKV
jgi:hypothetical protein